MKNLQPGMLHVPSYGPVVVQEITYLRAEGNYCYVYARPFIRPILCATPLAGFAQQLPGFLRPHKSYLVNPQHVDAFEQRPENTKCYRLRLRGGVVLPVARRRIGYTVAELVDAVGPLCRQ
ncbi:hypothetical protein F5984_13290 [Rudanella paleaurantiibacter]|uniref:HTH LytTR-type domain-containing protein n=1 Tax=Rudanella paleaurantiibacter TaxID=2614655 RepID=A0A7J5TYJ8_9BACT|nr:LytTR family DNA-binding domain-containing protein [Rudanella paleaurantiibacter]KAB7730151.1 hypothetical protein F5984_13290 [Rudanella paleaurantiibacter]